MKRLLLLTTDYPPNRGGVARYLAEMAEYFGDQMEVVAPLNASLTFRFLWPRWIKAFGPLLKRFKTYDVLVVSHVIPLGTIALIQKILLRKPYVVILHGMDFALARRNPWKRALTKKILRQALIVVTNSEALRNEVRGFASPTQQVVVYPCLHRDLLDVAETSQQKSLSPEESITFLTVARLVPRKGHLHVLEALSMLREHGLRPFRYLIIGDGPMYRELQDHVRSLGLQGSVAFMRDADDRQLLDAYRRADIFVMPTTKIGRDIEGFGTVYVEAAAFGIPSVASDLPGVNEAVVNEETGLLVPSSAPNDLSLAMERLMVDDELRQRLGANARARALATFTADQQFSKLKAML